MVYIHNVVVRYILSLRPILCSSNQALDSSRLRRCAEKQVDAWGTGIQSVFLRRVYILPRRCSHCA
jgi:hypothetical protein